MIFVYLSPYPIEVALPLAVLAGVARALLLGLVFNILNFEDGLGTISISAYWQMAIRGAFLFAVILFQARVMSRTHRTG